MKFLTDILAKAGLTVDGVVTLNSVAQATVDTDKFVVIDNGVVKYRTGAELLSDIGGNIYTADGTLTGNRTVTMGANTLTFSGANVFMTGSSATSHRLDITNTSTSADAISMMRLLNNAGNRLEMFVYSSTASTFNTSGPNFATIRATAGALFLVGNQGLRFHHTSGTSSDEAFRVHSNGNIGINTTTDAGFRLDVNGTTRIQNSLTISNNGNLITTNQFYGLASNYANGIFVGYDTSAVYLGYQMGTTPIHIGTGGSGSLLVRTSGGLVVENLAGTGTRMVVASSTGLLSTQSIPTLASLGGVSTNIYVGDGTLTGNRTVSMGNNQLTFGSTGDAIVNVQSATPNSAYLQVQNGSNGISIFSFNNQAYISKVGTNSFFGISGMNVGINTTTDAGFRLDVSGNIRTTTELIAGTNSTGGVRIGATSGSGSFLIRGYADTTNPGIEKVAANNSAMEFYNRGQASNAYTFRFSVTDGSTRPISVGAGNSADIVRISTGFGLPNANNVTGVVLALRPTYNQSTSTSTGTILTGIYYDPTLTDLTGVSSHRAIHTVTGDVLFGTTSGNVGIGTTSPGYNLHIQSAAGATMAVKATNTTTRAFTEYESYTSGNVMMRGFVGTFHDSSSLHVRTETAHPITFSTTNTERMRIFGGGNIGINTTTDSGFRLDVNGTTRVQGALTILTTGTTSSPVTALRILSSEAANGAYIEFADSNTGIVRSGNSLTFREFTGRFIFTNTGASNNIFDIGPTITSLFQGTFNVQSSITASSAIARGVRFNSTLVAAANNDVLVGLDIAPTFTNGSFTGLLNIPLRINSAGTVFRNDTGLGHSSIDFFFLSTNTYGFNNRIGNTSAGSVGSAALGLWDGSRINGLFGHAGNNANLGVAIGGTQVATWFSTGNLMLGETTDRGFRLHVEGNLNVSSSIRLNGGAVASNTGSDLEIGKTLSYSQTSIYGNTALGIVVSNTGTVRLANLAGTGDRMVVASSTGLLSTQAIPTLANLGGQAQLNGTGFVRMNGTTVNYDTTVFVTGDYYAPNAVFGQRPLRSQIVDNVLYQADSRFNVTRTDTGARIGNSLFNGNYDQGGFTIAAGTTLTFNLNFTANGNSSVTYTEGSVYLHFYYTSVPQSVSGRVKDSGGTWRNITNWTNISLSGGFAVWRGSVPGFNYMTDMEITITAQASINTQFNQWEYVQSRPGQYEWGIISKLQANNLWTNLTFRNATNTSVISLETGTGNITANAFIKTGGTSAQFLKADGSVDTNTYLTTNIYNSDGTLTGNRTVTMSSNNLIFSGGSTSSSERFQIATATSMIARVASASTSAYSIIYNEGSGWMALQQRGTSVTAWGIAGISELITSSTGGLVVATGTNGGPLLFGTANSERGRITAGGNWLINTTTDSGFRFDVNGTGVFRNSLTVNYGTTNRTTQITDTGFYISRTSDGTYSGSIVGDGHMTFGTRNYFAFNTNGSERFRIHENGNVAIGTTSDGGFKLDVNGTTRLNGNVNTVGTIVNNVAANSLSQLGILTSPTSGQAFTIDLGFTNNASRIRSSYVFTNFTAELAFGNTTGISQRLGNSDTGWSLASAGADTKQVVLSNNNTTGGSIQINNNSATVIAINTSNNVGIGTSSPSYKLDINGTVRATIDGFYGTNGTTTAPLIRFDGTNIVVIDAQGYGARTGNNLTVGNVLTVGSNTLGQAYFNAKPGTTSVNTRFYSYMMGRPDGGFALTALAGMGGFFTGAAWSNGIGLSFFTSEGTDISGGANISEKVTILPNGRLGIGTTSPGSLVELAATSTNAASLTVNAQGTGNATIRHFRGNVFKFEVGPGGSSDDYLIYNSGTNGYSLRIKNDATGNIYLGESAGNLFVGTTTSSSVYTTAKLTLNSSDGYTYQEIRGAQQSTLALTTGTSVGATPAVEIYNSYNFGIKFSQTSESSFLMFYHGTNKYLSFDTNSAERVRITSAGDVGIGTTTPAARLHSDYTPTWTGNSRISYYGALRQTVPASSTLNSGHTISASVSYLETTLQGSSTINAGAIFGGFVGINRVSFTAASSTLTMNSSAGSNLRAYSAMQVLMQTGGTDAGTITHGASLFVQGVYPINATVVTFTNYYGLLINDLTEWGTVAITNRWGIYQAGANDRNYFGGDTIFNRLAGTGTRMVVVDANGQLSTQAIPSGGGGVTTLNTLTAATQTFAVGTSGTDFNISSSTSTHTFNIPDASLTARGLITTGAQTISGNKIIRGTSTLNTEFALIVQNSAGTMLFQVRNDGGNVTVPSELRATGGISTNQITTFSSGNVNFPAQINTVNISIGNNSNIILATANGSKIGTATNQKLGFWNATPIVQPTTGSAAAAFVANTGTAVNDASTFDGYTMRQVVKALRDMGLLA